MMHPAIITAERAKADLVRKAAAQLGFAFQESSPASEPDLVKFHFGLLSDEDTMRLVNAVPREAYYFKAILGG